jgi:diaminopimelate epimerase
MARQIAFSKMHGAGNDYIYVDTEKYPLDNPSELAVLWSAPHTGIGADGLVLIEPSKEADFRMRIFNNDGSEALMCGNATRCIAKYAYEKGLTDKKIIRLETLSGIKELHLDVNNGEVVSVTVDMGIPEVGSQLKVAASGKVWTGTVVSMGNPHFVIETDDVESLNLADIGPVIEQHPLFPDRTNVEFAEVFSHGSIRMRVWERGSGITLACGTGACATLAALATVGKTGTEAVISMDGGEVSIRWDKTTGHIFKTGPAAFVFEGVINL